MKIIKYVLALMLLLPGCYREKPVLVEVFLSSHCSSCIYFKNTIAPKITSIKHPIITLVYYDTDKKVYFDLLTSMAETRHREYKTPTVIVAGKMLVGLDEIEYFFNDRAWHVK